MECIPHFRIVDHGFLNDLNPMNNGENSSTNGGGGTTRRLRLFDATERRGLKTFKSMISS